MDVDIWIVTRFSGKFSVGSGEYGILLETVIGDKPIRKVHCAAWSGISYQKLQVQALVDALGKMTKPAKVRIHIDSVYAVYVAENGGADLRKHLDLWQQYKALAARMMSCHLCREINETYKSIIIKKLDEKG